MSDNTKAIVNGERELSPEEMGAVSGGGLLNDLIRWTNRLVSGRRNLKPTNRNRRKNNTNLK